MFLRSIVLRIHNDKVKNYNSQLQGLNRSIQCFRKLLQTATYSCNVLLLEFIFIERFQSNLVRTGNHDDDNIAKQSIATILAEEKPLILSIES